jgi:hypothetical protein|tara:strand:- start:380 stop:541 length:162 start_codon:yes stop_codon:yes gene_type:complete
MYTSYDEACEARVSRCEAQAELDRHSASFEEFVEDCGDRDEYTGRVVLDWLGY